MGGLEDRGVGVGRVDAVLERFGEFDAAIGCSTGRGAACRAVGSNLVRPVRCSLVRPLVTVGDLSAAGPAVGTVTAALIYAFGGADMNLFRTIPTEAIESSLWSLGPLSVPAFTLPKYSLEAMLAIMPIAIATIPESTAHIYQLDIYVNNLARKKGVNGKYNLAQYLDRNLIGDGICDMVSGFVGGPAGTNYGENISTMAITKVFSIPVLAVAAIIAMVISFFTPLIQGLYAIPLAVIGGLEVYLFGAIAAQGIAIMIDKKVDMFSARNIAVISTIMIIGLGGQYAFGGNIPFFGMDVPCIAGAAIFGILLNLLLGIGKKEEAAPTDAA